MQTLGKTELGNEGAVRALDNIVGNGTRTALGEIQLAWSDWWTGWGVWR